MSRELLSAPQASVGLDCVYRRESLRDGKR